MPNPQQPELGRSRKTPAQDPDAAAGIIEGQRDVGTSPPRGPVPPENQPGNHPEEEQDKPDLDAFAAKFGVVEGDEAESEPPGRAAEDRDSSGAARTKGSSRPPALAAAAGASIVAGALGLLVTRKRRRSRRR